MSSQPFRTLDEQVKKLYQLAVREDPDLDAEKGHVAGIFERFNDARRQLEVRYSDHNHRFDS